MATFGKVRPIISTVFKGQRVVGVGNQLTWSPEWRTFPDFLFDYLPGILGKQWGDAELAKLEENRHVVARWYTASCQFRNSYQPDADGICSAFPDGPTVAFLNLAYDLYVLKDHLKLQERVLERLRHPDQFQGARYELFTIATCIRAGFRIEYEDERDSSRKHHEFTGIHADSGQRVSVEAKSKHRDGVLGRPGAAPVSDGLKVGIRRLLRRSFKPSEHPRVVFIDLNLPPTNDATVKQKWTDEALACVNKYEVAEGGKCPWNMLVLTNHPAHYGAEGALYPRDQSVVHIASDPAVVATHPEVLREVAIAVSQFGRIPQDLPNG